MRTGKRNHTAQFKAKVAIEAIKGLRTTNELATQFEIHPTQITKWKKQLLDQAPGLFTDGRRRKGDGSDEEDIQAQLYQQIGQLKVELDWLKKKSGYSH